MGEGLTTGARCGLPAIHLVAHDGDCVVGVDADRADADGGRAERVEPRARCFVEAVVVADEHDDVLGRERSVAEVARVLLEHVGAGGRAAEIGEHGLDAAARDREAGADLVPHAELGVGRRPRERLLHEDREHPLVGADEADVPPVDAQDARCELAAEQHEVDDGVAPQPVRDEQRRAQAAEKDVEPPARPRDVDEREVRGGRRLLSDDDEAAGHDAGSAIRRRFLGVIVSGIRCV